MIGRTFSSLRVPNYRRYFGGQVISITGNWMQIVGEMWLMVQLTGSGMAVGLTAGLQFLPILLFGAWGGLLADRMSKRTLLTITQLSMMVPALTLFALAASGAAEPWMVLVLVLVRGSVLALDNPARQSFVVEIVGPDRVVNAVALNSVVVHCARILGPAAAGTIIALVGIAPCFAVNAASFLAMFIALRTMDPSQLQSPRPVERRRGEVRSALRYVARTPELRIPLAMMALVGTISFNFQVLLPLLADFTWHGTAATYAALTAAMGIGSVAGALAAGARGRVSPRLLVWASFAFGVAMLLAAWAPTLELQIAALVPLGAASVTFAAGVNSALQIAVEPAMRGRVMALYSIVFLGSTPIGAPLVGWLAEVAGPRAGLLAGGAAALIAALAAAYAFTREPARGTPRPACRPPRLSIVASAMASPLETVALNHGAVMGVRHGRRVPARFSSAPTEEAVCVHAVGMADRYDRDTLELRGTPEALEHALVALGDRAWASFIAPDRAIIRCDADGVAACKALLDDQPDVTAHDRTAAYAAIGLIGPRAPELLNEVDLSPSGLIIREGRDSFEILLPAAHGPQLWDYLVEAGGPYDLACVGYDALERLSASQRRA